MKPLLSATSAAFLAGVSFFAAGPALAEPPKNFHQCTKTLTYQLYFNNLRIGQLSRTLRWQDQEAIVNSYSSINVLATKTRFKQSSEVYWSPQHQSFLSKGFDRNISGLMDGTTRASFSRDAKKSTVSNDGEKLTFQSSDKPILDVDAIGSQMRLDLIEGKTFFDYKMQESDDVSHYYFQVKGQETIDSNFGPVRAIRVEQIRKSDRKLVMWFSPDVDYQLVRATYQRKIVDVKAVLLTKNINCPPGVNTLSQTTASSATSSTLSPPPF
ncbi:MULTISPECIES: DUF3108 domain-containing protein [Photobacterium]|uniref:DUF3108 domain-containing protein n=1 Tax=Photobacterium ganghwense TaxID=320778 RepID=A0A0J1HIT6_9GAMM|nr:MULTISPECIES: DUF3108 domain-containing protein [Photobacterium]KLV11533.1 hypothetical protein ABT57_02015 [Photobacterium ganghwense]MBV1841515.1 DUF3108 domain-containing protein [Photobacterium ganghwense]PSU08399.1 DUF3108 domain-containing protein [Photobacterium ganghwense]QSV15207.1 DUF3108 domain-containing protein [Photobacterium ganghwense]